MAAKTNMRYVRFLEKKQPDHLRLCYVYSDEIPKANAHVAYYDHECDAWFSIGDNDWLSEIECTNLCWAHLPLPDEYKDERLF